MVYHGYEAAFYKWRETVAIERLLEFHLNRVAEYRDSDRRKYVSSVETTALLCPHKIRKRVFKKMERLGIKRCDYTLITDEKMRLYDELLVFILTQLEKENLIYKRRVLPLYGTKAKKEVTADEI